MSAPGISTSFPACPRSRYRFTPTFSILECRELAHSHEAWGRGKLLGHYPKILRLPSCPTSLGTHGPRGLANGERPLLWGSVEKGVGAGSRRKGSKLSVHGTLINPQLGFAPFTQTKAKGHKTHRFHIMTDSCPVPEEAWPVTMLSTGWASEK